MKTFEANPQTVANDAAGIGRRAVAASAADGESGGPWFTARGANFVISHCLVAAGGWNA